MASYERKNLRDKEKALIASLLKADIEKAEDYMELCRECPIEGPNDDYRIAREEAEQKRAIVEYLESQDKDHDWNEAFIAGWLKAYCLEKQKAMHQEANKKIEAIVDIIAAKDGKEPTQGQVDEANEAAKAYREIKELVSQMAARW